MIYLLSPNEIRKADESAIKEFNIPGSILMENASRSCFEILNGKYDLVAKNVLVLCGSGNNGGDGFALARHLSAQSNVDILFNGDESKMSEESYNNFEICNALNINIKKISENVQPEIYKNYDLIIDALIGVGAGHNLRGNVIDILQIINSIKSKKIAIDVPTGLNSLSGEVHKDCFRADLTLTMFAPKIGFYLNQAPNFTGEIITAGLSAPASIVEKLSTAGIYEYSDYKKLNLKNQQDSSKFDYGRVCVIGSSKKMPGAATLTANSAISAGAGLVELVSSTLHPYLLPEIIPSLITDTEYLSDEHFDEICKIADKSTTLAIGPGMGNHTETIELCRKLIDKYSNTKTIVLDADGIKAIDINNKYTRKVIITPHLGEFSSLIGIPREEIKLNALDIAKEWSARLGLIIHLKSVPSISTDGKMSYLNIYGNPGMASAGSGDVLTGIISSFTALGVEELKATALGSMIHSKAGDYYAKEFPKISLTASSIINYLKYVL